MWVSDPRFIQFALGSCYAVHMILLNAFLCSMSQWVPVIDVAYQEVSGNNWRKIFYLCSFTTHCHLI